MVVPMHQRLLVAMILVICATYSSADDAPCANPQYKHGLSYVLPLKYPPDFTHLEYANPDAPKGGLLRLPDLGTWDSFNSIIDKGRLAAGHDGGRLLVYDRLLESVADEAASAYGRLAEGVVVDENFRWIAFKLRENAYWHDKTPITVDDVVFSFEQFIENGSVGLKTALKELDRIEVIGEREVCFVTKEGAEPNPILPFAIGGQSILPKHYWESRDLSETTTEPPLGSGPYRLHNSDFGRWLIYERVDDYWGRDIPVNKGRYNFDRVKWQYFRDEHVILEAHKSNDFDLREESVSKNWTMAYEFPAIKAGLFKKELRYLERPWGMYWPVFFNVRRERMQDVRVREALFMLYDFNWINRVILYGFYNYGLSIFYNSPMASSGLPTEDELELLEPFRNQVPPRVFTHEFKPPPSTGFGTNRENMKRALELFEEAGWVLRKGKLRHIETNEQFKIEFVLVSAMLLRAMSPYIDRLKSAGIDAYGRAPEVSQWQNRMRRRTYDAGGYIYVPNNTPGLDLRNRFSSAAADQEYSLNWPGIKNPVIDTLIDKVIQARTAKDLYAATRALDRVMLWNFYFIPGMGQPGYRLVYWDKFGEVRRDDLKWIPTMDTWWWDEEKAANVEKGLAQLGDD